VDVDDLVGAVVRDAQVGSVFDCHLVGKIVGGCIELVDTAAGNVTCRHRAGRV
jgi:hypothetical protein